MATAIMIARVRSTSGPSWLAMPTSTMVCSSRGWARSMATSSAISAGATRAQTQ
ncbi:MAG: hypothetical protein U9R79_02920 [Armatimonadota bacterium]|nr:hypothetical protein [Armatimonadota bacterium]